MIYFQCYYLLLQYFHILHGSLLGSGGIWGVITFLNTTGQGDWKWPILADVLYEWPNKWFGLHDLIVLVGETVAEHWIPVTYLGIYGTFLRPVLGIRTAYVCQNVKVGINMLHSLLAPLVKGAGKFYLLNIRGICNKNLKKECALTKGVAR